MGKWVHRLSAVDVETKRAICAHCGPTDIKIRETGVRCMTKVRLDRHQAGSFTRYNITRDQRDELEQAQGGKCLICGIKTKLSVDHCHASGKVRGLLCHKCNVGLGFFEDNPKRLYAAIRYLV